MARIEEAKMPIGRLGHTNTPLKIHHLSARVACSRSLGQTHWFSKMKTKTKIGLAWWTKQRRHRKAALEA
jgi:hypothetical protein